jgi:diguanylate cyclase (GGDEF)-like protein
MAKQNEPLVPPEEILDKIFHDSPEFFVMLDPELNIDRAGAAFRTVTGIRKSQKISFLDTVERFSLSRVRTVFEDLQRGHTKGRMLHINHRLPDGGSVAVEYSWVSFLDDAGTCHAFVGIGRQQGETEVDAEEIQRFREELDTTKTQLERRAKEITRLREQLRNQSVLDDLTQLNNRKYILDRLETEAARAIRYDQPLTLILFDVDHMNLVNESHGREKGDEVLREVANVVQEQVRSTDQAARYAGEEFLILCPHTDRPSAQFLAERLRRRVAELSFAGEEEEFGVTVSVGLVTVTARNEFDVEAIIHAAEQALESAKAGGMNRVRLAEVT